MKYESQQAIVRIVDDDDAMRRALSFMLECEGYRVVCYANAHDFLVGDSASVPGCLVLDVRMPDMSGIELQQELNRRNYCIPILFLSGHGDLDMAVASMRDGAVDFIQKPVDSDVFISRIERALKICQQRQSSHYDVQTKDLNEILTQREQQVLLMVAKGYSSKDVGRVLHISDRTVEGHRQNGFRKLKIKSVAELANLLADKQF